MIPFQKTCRTYHISQMKVTCVHPVVIHCLILKTISCEVREVPPLPRPVPCVSCEPLAMTSVSPPGIYSHQPEVTSPRALGQIL